MAGIDGMGWDGLELHCKVGLDTARVKRDLQVNKE